MQFPAWISEAISTVQGQCSGTPELEIRFGSSNYGQFTSGVPSATFYRVLEQLERSSTPSRQVLRVQSNGSVRKISGEDEEWVRKEVLYSKTDSDLGMMIEGSCRESIVAPADFRSKFSRALTRNRFILPNSIVDLTVVCCTDNQEEQFEIEIRSTELDFQSAFNTDLVRLLELVQGSTIIYTLKERQRMLKFLERKFIKLQPTRLLRYKDLVYGGIVGNTTTGYVMSFRPQGVRKFLVFHNPGIWLVFPGKIPEVHLVSRTELAEFEGTILDGTQFLGTVDAPGSLNFLVQDALWVGNEEVRKIPDYNQRMMKAQQAKNRLELLVGPSILSVLTHTTVGLNTPDEFFRLVQEKWEEKNFMPYRVKGLIFIPANMPYNFPPQKTDRGRTKKRILTDQPDLVDWYPEEHLSLDLKVVQTPIGTELHVESGQSFQGTQINPFEGLRLDQPTGTVVEVGLNGLIRVRNDRSTANNHFRVMEMWDSMHDPITIEDLTGQTSELMKKYHARERRQLYFNLSGTLLVLNAGHGRDMPAWKKFSRIVLLENDPENLDELYRRLEVFGLTEKTLVIASAVENVLQHSSEISKFLFGGASNLVMTEGVQDLNWLTRIAPSLLQTGGKLILIAMDGDRVAQVFQPPLAGSDLRNFTLGPYHFSDFNGKSFMINQSPHSVFRWDSLILDLENFGFEGFKIRSLDHEKLLPAGDLRYTRFWTSLILDRPHSQVSLPEVTYPKTFSKTEHKPIPLLRPQEPGNLPEIYFPVIPEGLTLVKPGEVAHSTSLKPLEVSESNVDPSQELPFPGTPKLVRVGVYPQNSLLHAILLAFDPVYQDNPNYVYRSKFIDNLRQDMARYLTQSDPDFPGKTYFQSVWGSRGNLRQIRHQLNSDQPLGDEFLPYLTALLGFDFIVITASKEGIKEVYRSDEDLPVIALLKTGEHYELLGNLVPSIAAKKLTKYPEDVQPNREWIQTYFEPTDGVLKHL